MPTRTWDCLNRNCRARFDAGEDYPICPNCASSRLKWVPTQVNIAKASPTIDKDLRDLTEIFGLTDYKTPARGEAVKKIAPQVRTEPWTPQQGWTIPLVKDANGAPVATCAPSGMTSRVKGSVSDRPARFTPTQFAGGPVPVVEAAHRPKRSA